MECVIASTGLLSQWDALTQSATQEQTSDWCVLTGLIFCFAHAKNTSIDLLVWEFDCMCTYDFFFWSAQPAYSENAKPSC